MTGATAVIPGLPSPEPIPGMASDELTSYMSDCRERVLDEMRTFIPAGGPFGEVLYRLVFDYPLRSAKALRPALCIATCRALGGNLEAVLRSAAVLELYHNAFLIHDDVEDGSELRRAAPTLHIVHGTPIAINVGDAMLALALRPLLDNMRLLGLGRALQILNAVAEMAQETAEGQALELSWIRRQTFDLDDSAYLRMVHKKTSCYTFLAPMRVGALAAGATESGVAKLRRIAIQVGIAFQIQDDILNLAVDEAGYGKEQFGDLWEGKRSLILIHALRRAATDDRERAIAILSRPRPTASQSIDREGLLRVAIDDLEARGELTAAGRKSLLSVVAPEQAAVLPKTQADVDFLIQLIRRHDSIEYARRVAARHASRALRSLEAWASGVGDSVHLRFLTALVHFTLNRTH